jgi:hypothetical protein
MCVYYTDICVAGNQHLYNRCNTFELTLLNFYHAGLYGTKPLKKDE